MKFLLGSCLIVSLGSLGLYGQTPPDFSGTWTMDPSRSEAADQGPSIGPITVAIRQAPAEIRIETTRDGKTQEVRYLPLEMKAASTAEQLGTFRWDGSRLVTNLATHINNQAVTFEEVRTLNPEGTEMAVEVTLVVQHGYQSGGGGVVRSSNAPNSSTGKNVFVKAR